MEEDRIFISDEFGNKKEANIINIIEIDNQEYLLYSIEENEEKENIYAMKIIKNGTEEDLEPITDLEEKETVSEIIKEVLDELE